MEEIKYQVYCHLNKANGKVYFGVTKNTWQERWRTKYKGNQHFNRAITKYGEEAWEHDVLVEGVSREEAAACEKALIARFDAQNPEHGYNKGRGGEGISDLDSLYAKQHSTEYHEALSKAMKGVWAGRSSEERQAILDRRGFTKATHEQLSAWSKAAWQSTEYREKHSAYYERLRCEREADPEYLKRREEARERRKEYAKAYHKEHYIPVPEEVKRLHYAEFGKLTRQRMNDPVYKERWLNALRERMEESDVREAIRQRRLGTEHTEAELVSISDGMKEKWKGPLFRDKLCTKKAPRTEKQKEAMRQSFGDKFGRRVTCVETGVIYPSIAEAARSMGLSNKRFRRACATQKTVCGYHWEFLESPKKIERKVCCVETGVVYESLTVASEQTGICKSSISGACRGSRKTAGGTRWRYV